VAPWGSFVKNALPPLGWPCSRRVLPRTPPLHVTAARSPRENDAVYLPCGQKSDDGYDRLWWRAWQSRRERGQAARLSYPTCPSRST
jgi:hypothetical protein